MESNKTDGDGAVEPELAAPLRKRRWLVWLAVVFVAVAVVGVLSALRTRNLTAGQIVDQPGQYLSPNGSFHLKITETKEGNIRLTRLNSKRRHYFIPSSVETLLFEFEGEREWFFCFDKYDRLWVFRGKWNSQWGETHEISGGFVPHVPDVLREGFMFNSGQIFSGFNAVSSTGDWAGVPPEFFDRMPDKRNGKWGNITLIPDHAPPLTRQQESMARETLRRR
ncbi:MAG: hypothetical protein HOL01_10015 [Planctomycetaceae bacterium]|nr:hypothetical protein [Planctomycetaceae bacterium]MBT6485642.1 hypothetical protein [Planctomycetaceae bacterium]MBT6494874.1 hypothetical protein [Planctomycetaceae bacterium]